MAEASLAVGDEAETHCVTALSLAQEVGDVRLAGWIRGTQAQIALHAGDPHEAVAFAQAGQNIAPIGSAALARRLRSFGSATKPTHACGRVRR